MKSYLSNRSQMVRINDTKSSPRSITIGLPQGGLLSPTLFLFFINDLPNISSNFKSILFADDTTLAFKGKLSDLPSACASNLNEFVSWTTANRLSINVDKTFFISHSFQDTSSTFFGLKINELEVKESSSGEFLGLVLDKTLKFDHHIHKIAAKISRSVGILFKLSHYLSHKNLVQLYYSLIYPFLNYCNIA